MRCNQCLDSTYILSNSQTDRSLNTCMQFRFTNFCLRYDNNPVALGNSSFRCIECNRQSYIQDNQCIPRLVMPNECVTFNPSKDVCVTCQEGYFISDDGQSCIPYPQGIQGCQTYLSENTCVQCMPDYYQEDQLCFQSIVKVPNCKYYEDDGICQTCLDGYTQVKGRCLQIKALNCRTIETVNACASCNPGFRFSIENGVRSCVQTTIPNCIDVLVEDPFDCIRCSGNFYPNKQECTAVTQLITNCLEYSSATQCVRCSPLSALSVDKTKCVKTPQLMNHIDINCVDNFLNDQPVCNACQPGYVFQFNKCIACQTQVGCMICDPMRRNLCLMCQSGFIMTPEGNCMKPIVESSGIDNQGRSLKEFDMDDFVMRRL